MMARMAARVTTALYPDNRGYRSSGDQITLQYPLNAGCYAVTMCRREPRLPTPPTRATVGATSDPRVAGPLATVSTSSAEREDTAPHAGRGLARAADRP
jgi:hypothetical protein